MQEDKVNTIRYFTDCFEADNRELILEDFFGRKVENQHIITPKEELITNEAPLIPLDEKIGEALQKKLNLFQKEKELIYGSFFICGFTNNVQQKKVRICAPLFYFPAQLEQRDGFYYISISAGERTLNVPLLRTLAKTIDSSFVPDHFLHDFATDLIRFEHVRPIVEAFSNHFPNVLTEALYHYPDLNTKKDLQKVLSTLKKNDSDQFELRPASMVGIVAKSSQTRGVLNELKDLSTAGHFSVPLKTLLNFPGAQPSSTIIKSNERIPVILSEAQQALLRSSRNAATTLIIGPPGTGKTFTIGAIALEHMMRGESVLIASRTDEAVDVIHQKLQTQIGIDTCIVRGSRKRKYITLLRRFIKALLTRVNTLNYLKKQFQLPKDVRDDQLYTVIYEHKKQLKLLENNIQHYEKSLLKEFERELSWGVHLTATQKSLWNSLKTEWIQWLNNRQMPLWELTAKIAQFDQERIEHITTLIRLNYTLQIIEALDDHWKTFKLFYEALNLSSDTEKMKIFNQIDFQHLLKALPIWLIKIEHAKDILPNQCELFDVLIIDEATQCDIASCLPLIQRAKRVVVAGDPNQLRHTSFLSRNMQERLKQKHHLQRADHQLLNYRDNSILDLTIHTLQQRENVGMLDEHFRSVPPIIRFSNEQFYDNGLRIMTSKPDQLHQGIFVHASAGKRHASGYNTTEAEQLIARIKALIEKEKEVSDELATSVGVLSPFRKQVDYISQLILDRFTREEIEKHRIAIGTAYGFQGEERDIMHLSFVVDKDSHHAAFTHINKPDVFNVAVTRARHEQHVYTSTPLEKIPSGSLLRQYIEQAQQPPEFFHTTPEYDAFLEEVMEWLVQKEIKTCWKAFPIAGLTLDLLVKHNNRYFGIDLIGYPGEFETAFGLERYRILERAGIHVFPLPYSNWHFDPVNTGLSLLNFIKN